MFAVSEKEFLGESSKVEGRLELFKTLPFWFGYTQIQSPARWIVAHFEIKLLMAYKERKVMEDIKLAVTAPVTGKGERVEENPLEAVGLLLKRAILGKVYHAMLEAEKQALFREVLQKVENLGTEVAKVEIVEKELKSQFLNEDPEENMYRLIAGPSFPGLDACLAGLNSRRSKYGSEKKFIEKCIGCKLHKALKPIRFVMNHVAVELEKRYLRDHWYYDVMGEALAEETPKKKKQARFWKDVQVADMEAEPCGLMALFDDLDDAAKTELTPRDDIAKEVVFSGTVDEEARKEVLTGTQPGSPRNTQSSDPSGTTSAPQPVQDPKMPVSSSEQHSAQTRFTNTNKPINTLKSAAQLAQKDPKSEAQTPTSRFSSQHQTSTWKDKDPPTNHAKETYRVVLPVFSQINSPVLNAFGETFKDTPLNGPSDQIDQKNTQSPVSEPQLPSKRSSVHFDPSEASQAEPDSIDNSFNTQEAQASGMVFCNGHSIDSFSEQPVSEEYKRDSGQLVSTEQEATTAQATSRSSQPISPTPPPATAKPQKSVKLASKGENFLAKSGQRTADYKPRKWADDSPEPAFFQTPKVEPVAEQPLSFSTQATFKTNRKAPKKDSKELKDKRDLKEAKEPKEPLAATVDKLTIQTNSMNYKWSHDDDSPIIFPSPELAQEVARETVEFIQSKAQNFIDQHEARYPYQSKDYDADRKKNSNPRYDFFKNRDAYEYIPKRQGQVKQRIKLYSWQPEDHAIMTQKKTTATDVNKANQTQAVVPFIPPTRCFTTVHEGKRPADLASFAPLQNTYFAERKTEGSQSVKPADSLFFDALSFEVYSVVTDLVDFSALFAVHRTYVKNRLNAILQRVIGTPFVYLQEFGSVATGLLTPFSDLDLVMRHTNSQEREHQVYLLNIFSSELSSHQFVVNQTPVLAATVPVLKLEVDPSIPFEDFPKPTTKFTVKTDIIVEQLDLLEAYSVAIRTTEFTLWCIQNHPTFFEVVLLLKFALASNGLSNAYKGKLTRRPQRVLPRTAVLRVPAIRKHRKSEDNRRAFVQLCHFPRLPV